LELKAERQAQLVAVAVVVDQGLGADPEESRGVLEAVLAQSVVEKLGFLVGQPERGDCAHFVTF
jgi:hypothetical protein